MKRRLDMKEKFTTKSFIEKSEAIHGTDFFNYSFVQYENIETKVCIICPNGHTFYQAPKHHLAGHGCAKCATNRSRSEYSTNSFVEESIKLHGINTFNYSKVNYKNMNTNIIIICKNNHEFKQTPYHHLQGRGCMLCNNREVLKHNDKSFIKKSENIHNNYYGYSLVEYINNNTKVKIICPEHGIFEQLPRSHLSGRGCKKCSYKGTYSKELFIKNFKHKKCIFYILKCFNETEEFYKIGITSNTIQQRYLGKLKMPYNFEIIREIKDSAEIVWNTEFELKTKLTQKYTPKIEFGGYLTECYSSIEEIKSILKTF